MNSFATQRDAIDWYAGLVTAGSAPGVCVVRVRGLAYELGWLTASTFYMDYRENL